MRYYIIAGEASGDLHGSNLIKAIVQKDASADIRCWGGDKMQDAGAELVKHYRDLAFMGFVEVIRHLPEIFRNLKFAKQDIQDFQPDVLVLIDYPGFNLRIAKWAKEKGFKVVYYISPQVWAWKENRVKKIKTSVDKMLVILPFEKEFYKKHQFEVTYVGHPLADVVKEELKKEPVSLSAKPIVALLPGSRKQEIALQLPLMLSVTPHFPDYQFMIAKAPSLDAAIYEQFLAEYPSVEIVEGQTYNLLKQAKAAIVTSGTATLETALFRVPEVICYKGNTLSYYLARYFIKVKYIALVNLILDKPALKELIQNDFNTQNLQIELDALLHQTDKIAAIQKDYDRLWDLLSESNSAETAASETLKLIEKN